MEDRTGAVAPPVVRIGAAAAEALERVAQAAGALVRQEGHAVVALEPAPDAPGVETAALEVTVAQP